MTTSESTSNARFEIERLVYNYANCVDAGNFAGVAELFANGRLVGPDGTLLAEGYTEVLAFYRNTVRLYTATNTPLTQHVVSNLVLDIGESEDHASGSCSFTVFQQTDLLPLQPIIAGRYEDKYVLQDGCWQIGERRMVPLLVGDMSQHLLKTD